MSNSPDSREGSFASDRRGFLRTLGAAGFGALLAPTVPRQMQAAPETMVEATAGELYAWPEKIPLKLITDRPPQAETPMSLFKTEITPNEAFYVRTHLAGIPTRIDTAKHTVKVGGQVEKPFEITFDDLCKMPKTDLVAVNQCSGNSRALFRPQVPGVQWGNGAMGNAKWTGVKLKDLLERAGVKAGAVEVAFDGLDTGVIAATPDYVKAIPLERALHPDTIVAWAMNDAPLPLLNGFPLRLVVPGWYATYWIKWLTNIEVRGEALANFWMKPAYRIPTSADASETPEALSKDTVPINKMNVRSFIVEPAAEAEVKLKDGCVISGIAFDGGSGIAKVEVSTDGGKSWTDAKLGPDLGNYSFRRFTYAWKPAKDGAYRLMSRATAGDSAQQPMLPIWNRSGYMRNLVEPTFVFVA